MESVSEMHDQVLYRRNAEETSQSVVYGHKWLLAAMSNMAAWLESMVGRWQPFLP